MTNLRHRIAIITSHPTQYRTPIFKLLAARAKADLKVYSSWYGGKGTYYDKGVWKNIEMGYAAY